MNISILVPKLSGGGAERIAGLLSRELAKRYNVYLFLLKKEKIVYEYGGEIVYLDGDSIFFESSLKKNKEKYHIDCSISFLEPMNFANVRTKGNEKVIISERSIQSRINPRHFAEDDKLFRYYNNADAIVACSYGVKQDLIEQYNVNAPISVIYNFINQDKIKAAGKEKMSDEVMTFLGGNDYFISIGRLHEEKNPERLIRQYDYFVNKYDCKIKLIMIGSGRLSESLDNAIKEAGLEKNVLILPYMPNPFPYLKMAKALILCSEYEGLPNVVLESMVMRCPVIASDCLAGPRELLSNETDYSDLCDSIKISDRGILVSNNHSEDDCSTTYLAKAMEYICEHPEYIEFVKDNQDVYMRNYVNKNLVDQWIGIIENCNNTSIDILKNEFKWINEFDKKVILGTGICARVLYDNLKNEYSIDAFLDEECEVSNIDGIPVVKLNDLNCSVDNTVFFIGKGERGQDICFNKLKEYGYKNIIFPYVDIKYNYTVFDVIEQVKNEYDNRVVVVGAGEYGRNLVDLLTKENVEVLCVFDNNTELYGTYIHGSVVCKFKPIEEKCLYLITLYDADNTEKWSEDLVKKGVSINDICCFHL